MKIYSKQNHLNFSYYKFPFIIELGFGSIFLKSWGTKSSVRPNTTKEKQNASRLDAIE